MALLGWSQCVQSKSVSRISSRWRGRSSSSAVARPSRCVVTLATFLSPILTIRLVRRCSMSIATSSSLPRLGARDMLGCARARPTSCLPCGGWLVAHLIRNRRLLTCGLGQSVRQTDRQNFGHTNCGCTDGATVYGSQGPALSPRPPTQPEPAQPIHPPNPPPQRCAATCGRSHTVSRPSRDAAPGRLPLNRVLKSRTARTNFTLHSPPVPQFGPDLLSLLER